MIRVEILKLLSKLVTRRLLSKNGAHHKLGWRQDDITGTQKLAPAIDSATLKEGFDSASYGRTSIGALCPITSMAPVLAITGMVAGMYVP